MKDFLDFRCFARQGPTERRCAEAGGRKTADCKGTGTKTELHLSFRLGEARRRQAAAHREGDELSSRELRRFILFNLLPSLLDSASIPKQCKFPRRSRKWIPLPFCRDSRIRTERIYICGLQKNQGGSVSASTVPQAFTASFPGNFMLHISDKAPNNPMQPYPRLFTMLS